MEAILLICNKTLSNSRLACAYNAMYERCESKNIKTVQDLIERPDLDIIDALDVSVGQIE